MRGKGEIERLSRCTEPDIAVITNIGSAHIGLLGSRQEIAYAKCEIASFLRPKGFVVIPAGDSCLEKAISMKWKGRIVRLGIYESLLEKSLLIKEWEVKCLPKADFLGEIDYDNNTLRFDGKLFSLPLKGKHNALNLMFALIVSKELNISINRSSIFDLEVPPGHNGCEEINGINVMNETYNSSPEAVFAALDLLLHQPGRHFAVLGTMLELGKYSLDLHRKIIRRAVETGIDGLVIVSSGAEALVMKEEGKSLRKVEVVDTPEKALDVLTNWLHVGDSLLLKASRDVALDKLLLLLRERL